MIVLNIKEMKKWLGDKMSGYKNQAALNWMVAPAAAGGEKKKGGTGLKELVNNKKLLERISHLELVEGSVSPDDADTNVMRNIISSNPQEDVYRFIGGEGLEDFVRKFEMYSNYRSEEDAQRSKKTLIIGSWDVVEEAIDKFLEDRHKRTGPLKTSSISDGVTDYSKDRGYIVRMTGNKFYIVQLVPRPGELEGKHYPSPYDGKVLSSLGAPDSDFYALRMEAGQMNHCIGTKRFDSAMRDKDTQIYSVRDKNDKPVFTFHITGGNLVSAHGYSNAIKVPVRISNLLGDFFVENSVKTTNTSLLTQLGLIQGDDKSIYSAFNIPSGVTIVSDVSLYKSTKEIIIGTGVTFSGYLDLGYSSIKKLPAGISVKYLAFDGVKLNADDFTTDMGVDQGVFTVEDYSREEVFKIGISLMHDMLDRFITQGFIRGYIVPDSDYIVRRVEADLDNIPEHNLTHGGYLLIYVDGSNNVYRLIDYHGNVLSEMKSDDVSEELNTLANSRTHSRGQYGSSVRKKILELFMRDAGLNEDDLSKSFVELSGGDVESGLKKKGLIDHNSEIAFMSSEEQRNLVIDEIKASFDTLHADSEDEDSTDIDSFIESVIAHCSDKIFDDSDTLKSPLKNMLSERKRIDEGKVE